MIAIRRMPLPALGRDQVRIRVEACGICGTDLEQVRQGFPAAAYPLVPGHEPVGVVEAVGADVGRDAPCVGQRVVLEPIVPCGRCQDCTERPPRLCHAVGLGRYVLGQVPLGQVPGWWGGYATHLQVPSRAAWHPVPEGVPLEVAALFNPLAAGFDWVHRAGGLVAGQRVVILGAGARGLACVVAARAGGADTVVVTDVAEASHKLVAAVALGADHTVEASADGVVDEVRRLLGPSSADLVIDTTPGAVQPVLDALRIARRGGTVVLAGLKGPGREVARFPSDRVVARALTVRGVRGVASWAYQRALEEMSVSASRLRPLATHAFGLDAIDAGLKVLAGEVAGRPAVAVSIRPWERGEVALPRAS